jgi:chemotaxis protein CheX
MAASPRIDDALVQNAIVRAIQNVCQTMLSQDVRLQGKTTDESFASLGTSQHVLGSVGFVGEASGIVFLGLTEDFAKSAAGTMLGMSPEEVSFAGPEVLKDVIGEITNMTAGGFKNALCDIGLPCRLTLPTIVHGENLSVATIKGTTRHVFHFDCGPHRLIADIQIKDE